MTSPYLRASLATPRAHGAPLERTIAGYARAGLRDLRDGATQWRICYLLGAADMRRRYARSKLGQLWIMLSSTIMVISMGIVWSYLWKQPVREMLPYVAVGMVTWQLILSVIIDATNAMPASSRYFHNQYVSASTIIYAVLYRDGVTYLLNLIFPLLISLGFGVVPTAYALLSIVGLGLFAVAAVWVAFTVAILCTRFRDIVQIVNSIMQVVFFITPVIWKPETLSVRAQQLLSWNPIAIFISIIRDPLLGRPVPPAVWVIAVVLSFGGLLLTLPFIGCYRRRLIFWL